MNLTQEELCKIRLFAMDFDGIHTNSFVYFDQNGVESVRCSRIDSFGLDFLKRKTDIELLVISKEANPVVSARCNKLKIRCAQAVETKEGKLEILMRVMKELDIFQSETLYMGDDLQDLSVLNYVAIPITVPSGRPQLKTVCRYVTSAPGGNGAIREVCELLLEARGIDLTV